ncbi:hypothetical protein H8356DRAFT_1288575 [Neocallimastix lanati (nom. inval.)]|nr:hypothetical protein H8356DRAFT_1288575 [Neocallimastix sp. JGI-2020a]
MTYYDANWMNLINNKSLKLNQYNIPGNHDSGTYGIGGDGVFNSIRDEGGRTQSLNIKEQLYDMVKKFSKPNNEEVLTIDFMNMARMDHWYNPDDIFDNGIEEMAKFINKNIVDFDTNKNPFYNHWFILDFPDHDIVRKIYTSNDLNYSNNNYKRSNNNLYPLEYNEDLNIYLNNNNNYYIYKTEISKHNKKNIKTMLCIQLKLSNQIFDDRCLSYKNNKLSIDDCNNNNIYEDFIVYNKTLCSRVNQDNCLDDYKPLPVTLEPENNNLNCQSKIIKLGYQCCSNSIEIDHTDEIGTWGYENGELCGIPFDTLDLQDDVN